MPNPLCMSHYPYQLTELVSQIHKTIRLTLCVKRCQRGANHFFKEGKKRIYHFISSTLHHLELLAEQEVRTIVPDM